mmetsp:Transcript_25063/g.54295  ORF Transcript_25063/g.54295 Transcript_25063/m.54295 type:complete len:223 (-) Transcript_25063:238-906(-)
MDDEIHILLLIRERERERECRWPFKGKASGAELLDCAHHVLKCIGGHEFGHGGGGVLVDGNLHGDLHGAGRALKLGWECPVIKADDSSDPGHHDTRSRLLRFSPLVTLISKVSWLAIAATVRTATQPMLPTGRPQGVAIALGTHPVSRTLTEIGQVGSGCTFPVGCFNVADVAASVSRLCVSVIALLITVAPTSPVTAHSWGEGGLHCAVGSGGGGRRTGRW